eukprot:CAMPEP_0196585382 /NCGR_PEP_ID=MMETSP1081-20130531/50433_1 /TAXON_ID=36882 /ORGANISM="Pyramimonas amylifera, Strain CCMP720" /LENGTH=1314 /DNA_ID=CAMNT_0041906905 /DNA_START=249 /DNA_END=4193 /DNA_ORIENTATION=-
MDLKSSSFRTEDTNLDNLDEDEETKRANRVVHLNASNLSILIEKGLVSIPTYAREITEDRNLIYHFGVGGFHRSHQAFYLNDLLSRGENWALVGVGIMPFDQKMHEVLKAQDFLYTLMSRGSSGFGCSVVGSIMDFVYAPDDICAAMERLAHPQCKIVSLTITEKGYCWNKEGHLDLTNPLIINDLNDIARPSSALGYVTYALKLRKERGLPPFTVMSCDNIPENGPKCQRLVVELANRVDPDLGEWIATNVPFPMTMVDRITPVTNESDIQQLAEQYGIEDAWPVVAEDFMQWVIEDRFVDGCRPKWEMAGALVVEDVTVYELMKIRVLNGGHSALSCVAYLLGHRDVHKAMADSRVLYFVRAYFSEVSATVPPVPGVDLEAYQNRLVQRFSNVHIADKLQRLAEDGSMKLYNTMREPILELLAKGKSIELLALAIAAYSRYMMAADEQGQPILIKDPMTHTLHPLVWEVYCGGASAKGLLEAVFGSAVCEADGKFVLAVDRWIAIIKSSGVSSAISTLIPVEVSAYEAVKLRLLDGGYCALACVSILMGHQEVDEAISDSRISQFLKSYFAEVVATVPDMGEDLREYELSLIARFNSQHVRDKLPLLAQNASMKLFNSMRGAILELLNQGDAADVMALAVAAYSRYMMGSDEQGQPICIVDSLTTTIYPLVWQMYCGNASSRKLVDAIFGYEVSEQAAFVASVDTWVDIIKGEGLAAALQGVAELWKGSEIGDDLSDIGDLAPGPVKLRMQILEALKDEGAVLVPTYNREITPERNLIYHMGVGGFHRSHQAFYLHDLLMKGEGANWAIVGMGILPGDKAMSEALIGQDCLYTLTTRGSSGFGCSVVGSIMDFVYALDDVGAAVEKLAQPQCKIVSLTITEKGYCWDQNGHLDLKNSSVVSDLEDITKPRSALGFIVAALKLRKARGLPPFTVLSCDNIPENGQKARRLVLELASRVDPELQLWIESVVPFPMTMVDRITPVTTDLERLQLQEQYGIEDAWPVVAEDFMQWVVEDNFVDGCRPPWEMAGALMVQDVTVYETMKIRLLNGGHSAMSYVAFLLGHRDVDKAMSDPRVTNFLRAFFAEVVVTVPEVPGVDLEHYQVSLLQRFGNVHIRDQVSRLACDGSLKLLNTMKGSILDRLSLGLPVEYLALAIAGYSRYMMGVDEQGQHIPISDPMAKTLHPLVWKLYCSSAGSKKFIEALFGREISEKSEFVSAVDAWIEFIKTEDLAAALSSIVLSVTEVADSDPAVEEDSSKGNIISTPGSTNSLYPSTSLEDASPDAQFKAFEDPRKAFAQLVEAEAIHNEAIHNVD